MTKTFSTMLGGLNLLGLGLEDEANGLVAREKEYVWYGKLTDTSDLQKAAKQELQRQSAIKRDGGQIRVRETICNGVIEYTLTAKHYVGRGDASEVTVEASKGLAEVFRQIAGESMDKLRYTFPIEGTDLKWEVDVFIDLEGNFKGWVKVDLEVKGTITEWPPLPIGLSEVIFGGNDPYTPEQKEKLDGLFATVFSNKLQNAA